jgi:hypothetical protein
VVSCRRDGFRYRPEIFDSGGILDQISMSVDIEREYAQRLRPATEERVDAK